MERGYVPDVGVVLDLSEGADWLEYKGISDPSTRFVVIGNTPDEENWMHRRIIIQALTQERRRNLSVEVLDFPAGSMVHVMAREVGSITI